MSPDEWLRRCAAQYVKRGALKPEIAMELAKVAFECDNPLDKNTPEESADNDMDCWDRDEDGYA